MLLLSCNWQGRITPYSGLVICTDTYPGAVTDKDLYEQCGPLDMIKDKSDRVLTVSG